MEEANDCTMLMISLMEVCALRLDMMTDRVHPPNITASALPIGGGGRSAVQLLSGEDIASAGGGGGGSNCLQSAGCGGGGKSHYDLHGSCE